MVQLVSCFVKPAEVIHRVTAGCVHCFLFGQERRRMKGDLFLNGLLNEPRGHSNPSFPNPGLLPSVHCPLAVGEEPPAVGDDVGVDHGPGGEEHIGLHEECRG